MANQRKRRSSKRNDRNDRKDWKKRDDSRKEGKANSTRSNIEYEASDNDPAWYASNMNLLMDGFSYPFNQVPGMTINLDPEINQYVIPGTSIKTITFGDDANPSIKGDHVSPGLMVYYLRSRYDTEEANNALNTAANAQYIFTNSLNSRNFSYDPNDLMIYNLAMTEVYSAIVWLQRIYGLAWMYAQQSSYMPYACLKAMGINTANLSMKLASFREGINWIIAQVDALPVPATMKLYQRKVFLYSEVYTEGASVKDQMYMLVPQSFYWFEFDETTKAGTLVEKKVPYMQSLEPTSAIHDVELDDLLSYVQNMFSIIWTQQDHQAMGADILRAYQNNIIRLAPLEPNTFVVPRPDQFMVLEQMKNATVIDMSLGAGTLVQNMETNKLKFEQYINPVSSAEGDACLRFIYQQPRIITTLNPSVPPALMAELTRLTACGKAVKNAAGTNELVEFRFTTGTEFVQQVRIVTRKPTTDGTLGELVTQRIHGAPYINAQSGTASGALTVLTELEMVAAFQYSPHITPFMYQVTGSSSGTLINVGDEFHIIQLDNYTTLSFDDLVPMNAIALMSLLNVPTLLAGK